MGNSIGKLVHIAGKVVSIITIIFSLFSGIILLTNPNSESVVREAMIEFPKVAVVAFLLTIGIGGLLWLIGIIIERKFSKPKDIKGKETSNNISKPSIDIHIDSKDIRYMDSKQIDNLFKGVKRSLIEYRKTLRGHTKD